MKQKQVIQVYQDKTLQLHCQFKKVNLKVAQCFSSSNWQKIIIYDIFGTWTFYADGSHSAFDAVGAAQEDI